MPFIWFGAVKLSQPCVVPASPMVSVGVLMEAVAARVVPAAAEMPPLMIVLPVPLTVAEKVTDPVRL